MKIGPAAPDAKRDVRIDRIGFAKELDKLFTRPEIERVKLAHPNGRRLFGDYFEAYISQGTDREITPAAWLRLYEKEAITKPQFLAGLSVLVPRAEKLLDATTFARLVKKTKGSRRLDVNRKKGLQVELVDAVYALHDHIRNVGLAAA
jgi:hypothetical protein